VDRVADPVVQRRERREIILRRTGVTLGALGIVGALMTGTYSSISNNTTLNTVKDCTDPKGKCYRDGQRRTAEAVSDLSRIIILAAACAVDVTPSDSIVERQAAITTCITKRIAASQP
jgi:hypothetical protein